MRKGYVSYIKEKSEIDISTGEIKKHEIEMLRKEDGEPSYVKVYIDDLSRLYHVPTGSRDLICALLRKMEFDGRVLVMSPYKEEICKEINIKDQTFKNIITKLCKAGIISLIGRGVYRMNPNLFGKGTWKQIKKQREDFRLVINYTYEGERTISTEFVEESKTPE